MDRGMMKMLNVLRRYSDQLVRAEAKLKAREARIAALEEKIRLAAEAAANEDLNGAMARLI